MLVVVIFVIFVVWLVVMASNTEHVRKFDVVFELAATERTGGIIARFIHLKLASYLGIGWFMGIGFQLSYFGIDRSLN